MLKFSLYLAPQVNLVWAILFFNKEMTNRFKSLTFEPICLQTESLMALFVEQLNILSADIANIIKSKLYNWVTSQSSFIRDLFANLGWES